MTSAVSKNVQRPNLAGTIRLGLCCSFRDVPIRFRTLRATSLAPVARHTTRDRIAEACLHNANALRAALDYCRDREIGCFRINSGLLPLKTHPQLGYELDQLPQGVKIAVTLLECGRLARQHGIRTSFHPDQFVVLNSPREDVVQSSIRELDYLAEVAGWLNADVINIHAGGVYGDKAAALDRLCRNLERLAPAVRERLTLENDDTCYTPADLLPLCRREGLPLVYDVHHHRCLGDGLKIEQATSEALATWNREPLFHISSPRHGWHGPHPRQHHDYVDPRDFPRCWLEHSLTVEVEAKAKEQAVDKLHKALAGRG